MDAPTIESMAAPAIPPRTMNGKASGLEPARTATAPTKAAPASAAIHPASVTPPDSPTVIRRQVRIDRGVCPTSVPISVAQVSAADAASEAAADVIQLNASAPGTIVAAS